MTPFVVSLPLLRVDSQAQFLCSLFGSGLFGVSCPTPIPVGGSRDSPEDGVCPRLALLAQEQPLCLGRNLLQQGPGSHGRASGTAKFGCWESPALAERQNGVRRLFAGLDLPACSTAVGETSCFRFPSPHADQNAGHLLSSLRAEGGASACGGLARFRCRADVSPVFSLLQRPGGDFCGFSSSAGFGVCQRHTRVTSAVP